MTETEKMRTILHERGIEYRDVNSMVTDIEHDGIKTRVYDYDDGPDYQLCVEQKWLTAEEAVRVALGIQPQEVLERRIDELCADVEKYRSARDASVDLATKTIDRIRKLEAEVEQLHADQAHWELGNCPNCPNIADLQEALEQNAKLRELAQLMHDHIKECCDCCDEWYCSEWDEDNECCRFDTMMRVCGIEVG